jgi:hypothetical protein
MPLPPEDEIVARAKRDVTSPIAIEALWDGDTSGWFVTLMAVMEAGPGEFRDQFIVSLRDDGGDLRLFNEQVPPWPEARLAQTAGERLASYYGVPFYFPSPNHPEENCPRWWQQSLGTPCRKCGIPLLQNHEPCPWRGLCYHCHLEEERQSRS